MPLESPELPRVGIDVAHAHGEARYAFTTASSVDCPQSSVSSQPELVNGRFPMRPRPDEMCKRFSP